ncbi:MAG: SurA N-terminal domain-containing protein [Bacteroidales bacterium]
MSALQFLRERAGVLVAGVIGLSLFIFVVSDFFGRGRTQRRAQRKYYEIGMIDGKRITYQDFELRIKNLEEIYKLSGTSNLDEATLQSLREQMWQQMIREKILDAQYEDLGIAVTPEELEGMVLGNEPHPIVRQLFTDKQTGMFNKSALVNFLKNTEADETAKKYWLFFEDEIVADRLNTKYNTLVSKGLYATSKQAEFESKLDLNTVDISYVMKSYSAVADSNIAISDNEVREYFSKHKENYKKTAQRDLEYVTFDIKPSADDYKQALDWINKTKTEFLSTADPVQFINTTADTRHTGFYTKLDQISDTLKPFVKKETISDVYGPWIENDTYKIARLINVGDRPDSVHVRHILISPKQNLSLAQAKAKADSLVKILKGGMPFAAIALTNSDDQGSAQQGGDLGWFGEGLMILPFNNACFTAKKGDLTIVETSYGYHIIEILDISKKVRKYEVGIIDRKVEPSTLTTQKVYAEASQFAGTNNTYEKFTKAVAENKLDKRVASNVLPQQKELPGLEKPRQLIMSLFQAEHGKIILDNNQQAVFEIGNKYVVGYCTKVVEEGYAKIADVAAEVKYSILKEKKADLIAAELKAMSGKSLDNIASTIGTTVQEATNVNFRSYSVTGAGIEPALIAAATVAEQGKVTGPVKGNNGVFMLTVNNINKGAGEDSKLIKDRLAMTFQMRGTYEAYNALMKSANIVDKRYKFY